jgi:hypothetical protein
VIILFRNTIPSFLDLQMFQDMVGYINVIWPKERSPEVWHIPPGHCVCVCVCVCHVVTLLVYISLSPLHQKDKLNASFIFHFRLQVMIRST